MAIINLAASIDKLDAAVDALINAGANTVPQADVDAQQARVDVITAKVVAAIPVAAPAPTPAA